jgi:predicted DNA-binding protein YlxM (UPF0122 family)
MKKEETEKVSKTLQRRINMTMLYDLYSPLLTGKQREIFELHEILDFSLSEISEKLGTSRQGIHDILNRTFEKLERTEKELGFGCKLDKHKDYLINMERIIEKNRQRIPEELYEGLNTILDSAKGDL